MTESAELQTDAKPAKWTITVGGNEWGTVKYGIVEYLRKRPRMRAIIAILGLLWVVGWVASTMGFKWHLAMFPAVSAVFVTPTLLWFAVVSGPDFALKFPEPKTPDPQVAPTAPTKSVLDPEGYGIEALDKSYLWTEGYARSSFRWSMFSLVAAISIGTANLWLISVHSSVVAQFNTATFIWVFAATLLLLCIIFLVRSILLFRRAAIIHDRLLQLQKTITAIKYLERTPQNGSASLDASLVISSLLTLSKNGSAESRNECQQAMFGMRVAKVEAGPSYFAYGSPRAKLTETFGNSGSINFCSTLPNRQAYASPYAQYAPECL